MLGEDDIAELLELGRQNQEIITLARSWCRHVRQDRGPMGVGIPEQMTGLPISGGSLACDFAEPPTTFGHQLAHTAADFYAKNCVGCPHHSPPGVIPNLRTWAEPILQRRRDEAERALAERRALEEERDERRRQRRLGFATPDAFAEEVLGLVERLDAEARDPSAAEELLATARLNPDGFTPGLIDMLRAEAGRPGMDACLATLLELNERTGNPDRDEAMALAVAGLHGRIAFEECGDAVARLAQPEDAKPLFEVALPLVGLAGRTRYRFGGPPADVRTAGLLRLHELAPEETEAVLADELKRGEVWRRSTAAVATRRLLEIRPTASLRMLRALLDGLKVPDPGWGDAEEPAAPEIGGAIGVVLRTEPEEADRVVATYLKHASDAYIADLMHAYDGVLRGGRAEVRALPTATIQMIATRATEILVATHDETVATVSGTALSNAIREGGAELTVNVEALLGALVFRAADYAELSERKNLDFFSRSTAESRLSIIRREISDAVAELAQANPDSVWPVLLGSWETAEPPLRREILNVLVKAAEEQRERLNQLLPIVYTAMGSTEVADRRDALRILKSVSKWYRKLDLPEAATELALRMLTDPMLAVVNAAIDLVPNLSVPDGMRGIVLVQLLMYANVYAQDRLRDDNVQAALAAALELTSSAEEANVHAVCLQIINKMPAHSAAEALRRLRALESSPNWAETAVRALRVDEDPQWFSLGEDDREALLSRLVDHAVDLEAHVDQLVQHCLDRVRYDRAEAAMYMDALSGAGYHAAALRIADAAAASVPNTHEMRFRKARFDALRTACQLEVAIAAADSAVRDTIVAEWRNAQPEA